MARGRGRGASRSARAPAAAASAVVGARQLPQPNDDAPPFGGNAMGFDDVAPPARTFSYQYILLVWLFTDRLCMCVFLQVDLEEVVVL
jgi:hypothetical protein